MENRYLRSRKEMKTMVYQTKGTCAKEIRLDVENGVIHSVEFVMGCPGFTQALSRLLAGMRVEDAIARLDGIQCLDKGTSCPDQLARALKAYRNQTAKAQTVPNEF